MAKNTIISIYYHSQEIGRLGFDENKSTSYFQYNKEFLEQNKWTNLFPFIFRRIPQTQAFYRYNNETFRGLPPMIADSLPDMFGNIIFKAWMESVHKDLTDISVLEQLAYVGTRGMGALEYQPSKQVTSEITIDINEITQVVKQVLEQKENSEGSQLDHAALLTIFKLGSSAGGMRPKILVSENKKTGKIIPGDIAFDDDHYHYLVKLGMQEETSFSREVLEYCYYLSARHAGIDMMDSKMIENRHFATLRYDRQNGKKIHSLTVTGLTGLDYKNPKESSYENIFKLLVHLKCPHKDTEQLFRRMIFNLVFANHDDHLKNHSLRYHDEKNSWELGPAYDITYSLNPELNYTNVSRALSINGKRKDISLEDLKKIAEDFTISNYKGIITEVQDSIPFLIKAAKDNGIPDKTLQILQKNFMIFLD